MWSDLEAHKEDKNNLFLIIFFYIYLILVITIVDFLELIHFDGVAESSTLWFALKVQCVGFGGI